MGAECGADLVLGRHASTRQRHESSEDPRRAEATLARPRRLEGDDEPIEQRGLEPRRRGDAPSRHPSQRRHAGDPRHAIDEDRAAAALPLGAAAILHDGHTELVSQRVEKGPGRREIDSGAINLE